MTERIRITSSLLNLITDFEHSLVDGMSAPLDQQSYQQIIGFYEEENRIEKALDVLEKAIVHFPYSSDLLREKSRLLLRQKKYDDSHNALDQAEILAPFKVDILLQRAKILAGEHKFEQAFQIIDDVKSFARKDDEVAAFIVEAEIAECHLDYELMFQALKNALILKPTSIHALTLMKSALNLSKHFEECILIHSVIIENHPYTALAWYNLGHSFVRASEYENAIDALEYAFLIDPEFEDAYYDCAELCMEISDFQRAEIILEEAILVFENNYDSLHNLAICKYELGKVEEAKRSLFEAMQLEPYCEELHFLLAKCYIKDQDWVSAIKMLESAIDLEDQMEEYYFHLAKIYEQTNKKSKANTFYRKAAFVGEEQSYYWEEYITFLLRNGDLDVAEKYINISAKHTYSNKIAYLEIANKLMKGERSCGLRQLAELIQEDFEGINALLDVNEIIKEDKEVMSIIHYYEQEKDIN